MGALMNNPQFADEGLFLSTPSDRNRHLRLELFDFERQIFRSCLFAAMFEEDLATSDWAITWRDLSVSVKSRTSKFFQKNPQPYRRLINNVTGAIKTGSLVVLMGPSGAGKSTLMGALSHRNASDVFIEGDVRMRGVPVSSFAHRISGFMHQDDLFVGTLTVREHLHCTAKLKLGRSKNGREINSVVERLIIEMGLLNCADTRIGAPISGGERKRLSFATEVMTDPPILFCDEPTTGLDSFSAQYLITLLKQMSSRGKTILCTVHQPSSEVFSMFEQLIFLAEGRTAFIGDATTALKFFERHGIVSPPNYNPAEVIIGALSVSSKGGSLMTVKRLCDEYSVSETATKIDEMLGRFAVGGTPTEDFGLKAAAADKSASWMTKFFWLTHRSFLQVLRDPSVQFVRIIQKLGIALMAGLCFFGSVGLTQAGVQSIQGAIFVLVTENTFPPMYGVLSHFPEEFPLYLREYRNDLYTPPMYYIAKTVSFLPGLILEPVLFVTVAYLISGLKKTLYAFIATAAVAILTNNVAAACGSFFSNVFGSVPMALAFLVPIDYTLMATSGIFMKLSSIPKVIAWFRHLSWFMYANEALSIVQWESVHNISTGHCAVSTEKEQTVMLSCISACEYENPEIPCLEDGRQVLEQYDFSSSHLSQDILAMGVLYCVFHILAYVSLRWKTNKNS